MSAEVNLYNTLLAASAVTALAGNRIAADRMEQGAARPFIVFTRTSTEPYLCMDGTVLGGKATLDVQIWADTRNAAEALADACTAAIRATRNVVSNRSAGYDSELDLEASLLTVDWQE